MTFQYSQRTVSKGAAHKHSSTYHANEALAALLTYTEAAHKPDTSALEPLRKPLSLIVLASSSPLDEEKYTHPITPSGYATVLHDGRLVALSAYDEHELAINELVLAAELADYTAVFSLPFYQLEGIPHHYDLIVSMLDTIDDPGIHDAKNGALAYLTSEIAKSVYLQDMLHPALGKLQAYDNANQSELLHTLEVYLENDCNAQKCGRLLFLHRNSLSYRVRRIQEIGECDLSDSRERSYLRFSIQLRNQTVDHTT